MNLDFSIQESAESHVLRKSMNVEMLVVVLSDLGVKDYDHFPEESFTI